jgi:superfamily II DNA or RNA helicase
MSPLLTDIHYRVIYRPSDNPLETFYLPTLAASVRYDRSAGFFRSSALAAAAAGIVRLIQNNGTMRLLVGAELSEEDAQAIQRGYDLREALTKRMLGQFPDPSDGQLIQRLEALAWMVANGTLDIKVVLPLDERGFPIPGSAAYDYYHTKKGIFTDAQGNQVGFVGSVNESAQAWKRHFEEFAVYCSWEGQRDREALGSLRVSFNEVWDGQDPHWLAVELPEAVRQKLLKYVPDRPPARDPLERKHLEHPQREPEEGYAAGASPEERVIFQFLRDAPYLPYARDLGAQTGPVRPWPHQLQVARAVAEHFPDRVLLCDEVGLGKTIEAGLVIRQLLLSGRVKRCLILVPASVLKQWQEELYEKFNLDVPRYDAGQVWDVHDRPVDSTIDNPWDECDLLLASSHLAKRKERRPELLAARPWDLLVVDEAHHARRRDFLQPRYRPNSLLTLLNQLKANDKYRAMILATATPMQVDPVEVWDLLIVLGLGGRWGADQENFLRFFQELRHPYGDVNWDFVYDLVSDHLGTSLQLDPSFDQAMEKNLGPALAHALRGLPRAPHQRAATLRNLPPKAHPYVAEMARRHTPIDRYMFRNTRDLLREYIDAGILNARVPEREPQIRRIPFRPDEAELYERITEYISRFYQKYEAERRGLGFIMTVYRRRLTSSFYAIRRSLERRRDWLQGVVEPDQVLTPEDQAELDELDELEQAGQDLFTALRRDGSQLTSAQRANFQLELDYLDNFIGDLRQLSQADSKLTYLKDELERVFRERSTALVFTQYTDTMDYLRDQLVTVYGSGVACYSGRGGEVWNSITGAWVSTTKEHVKNRFRAGEIKVLLGTESASEGLNLQTCGVLINYDMPWNPMRVEQRIGRIDRIGQEFEKVWIYNYFYKDSIEDRIYQALSDRIAWFEDVIGDLQPILTQVGEVTRKLAMLPAQEQAVEFEEEIRRLRAEIDSAQLQALNLNEYLDMDQPDLSVQTPVTLADLETILTQSNVTRHLFQPHLDIPDAYQLRWNQSTFAVTFSREAFDTYPDTLQFLSYGNPIFAELIDSIPEPEDYPVGLARFVHSEVLPVRAWYRLGGTRPAPLSTLSKLRRALGEVAEPAPQAAEAASQHFEAHVQDTLERYRARVSEYSSQYRATLQARARRLLVKGALVEIALGRQRTLFAEEAYPVSFDESAVAGLRRHKSPWSWLLVMGGSPLPQPSEADPFFEEVRRDKPDKLKELFQELTEEARQIVQEWRALAPKG